MANLLDLRYWERCLNRTSTENLTKLVRSTNRWFADVREGTITRDEYRKILAGSRRRKIDYILGSDPIATEGGLCDFLYRRQKSGLVAKPKK